MQQKYINRVSEYCFSPLPLLGDNRGPSALASIRSIFLSIWPILAIVIQVTDVCFLEKSPLAIAIMNAELPSSKNGEDNFESASTLDRGLTSLRSRPRQAITIESLGM